MTKNNEQIIIDGVDVSGCAFYGFSNLNNHLCRSEEFSKIDCTYCNNNPNCYFKQLKRKEQECEGLTSKCSQLEEVPRKIRNIILKFAKQDILTFPDLKPEDNYAIIQNQCLDPIRQIIKFLDEMENKNA